MASAILYSFLLIAIIVNVTHEPKPEQLVRDEIGSALKRSVDYTVVGLYKRKCHHTGFVRYDTRGNHREAV